MLECGPATKATIHLNQGTDAARSFLANEVFQFLRRSDIEDATMMQAHVGDGSRHQLHTAGAGGAAGLHIPVIIYYVETQQKIDATLGELCSMVTDRLIEVHPTTILKIVTSSERVISR
jgi:hypothetical protein